MIITAVKGIFNSDKICRSYSDLNFGVTFLEHSVGLYILWLNCLRVIRRSTALRGTGFDLDFGRKRLYVRK